MFYYKFRFAKVVELKSQGRVRKFADFGSNELLTEREMTAWIRRAKWPRDFEHVEGCQYSSKKVTKIGKRRFVS